MTPHKLEACRAEIEILLKYDILKLSKGLLGCHELKERGTAKILLRLSLPERGGHKRRLLSTTYRREPLETFFFTKLNLGSAFWQVLLRKKDREKTGFACELGFYQWKTQWKTMLFGLCNATGRPFIE